MLFCCNCRLTRFYVITDNWVNGGWGMIPVNLLWLILVHIHKILTKIIHLQEETWFEIVPDMLKLSIIPIARKNVISQTFQLFCKQSYNFEKSTTFFLQNEFPSSSSFLLPTPLTVFKRLYIRFQVWICLQNCQKNKIFTTLLAASINTFNSSIVWVNLMESVTVRVIVVTVGVTVIYLTQTHFNAFF